MNEADPTEIIQLDYFSDILCVWSYIAQVRVDELREKLGNKISISYHYINIFGCTENRIKNGWKDRGGYAGFGQHVIEACKPYPHIVVHPDIWKTNQPVSSASCHLFLKALQNLEATGELADQSTKNAGVHTTFEKFCWLLRCTFFRDNRNIGLFSTLYELAESMQFPIGKIEQQIANGNAFAALCADSELQDSKKIEGSPTFLLNQGRQKLFGNVGYRIIEANIEELLQRPKDMASWC